MKGRKPNMLWSGVAELDMTEGLNDHETLEMINQKVSESSLISLFPQVK